MVARTRGEGREVLRAFARSEGSWLGLEVTTPRRLALELVGPELAREGLAILDEFAELALVDELLDDALQQSGDAVHLRDLGEGAGFRRALRGALSALRLAAITPDRVENSPAFADVAKRDLVARLLRGLIARVRVEDLVDTAEVLRRATRLLRNDVPVAAAGILLLPGLGMRGLAGRFVRALRGRGALTVQADRVHGLRVPEGFLWDATEGGSSLSRLHAPPSSEESSPASRAAAAHLQLSVFRAAGVTEELREILRRILAAGLSWDEVEIVTPDPFTYGPALHTLGERLGIPTTFAVGLPVERTRPGRVVAAWFRWLEEDFPEWVVRGLLAKGDLAPRGRHRDVWGPSLARGLRRLRIGWGRDRYVATVEASLENLRSHGPPRPRGGETAEKARERHERDVATGEALRALLVPIMAAIPPLPTRLAPNRPRVSPADLASGLAEFLRHLPRGSAVDDTALERLGLVLDRVRVTQTRPTTFPAAVARLREHLAIPIPAPRVEGKAPWGSAGGHLHLSDVTHGGFSGRRVTFVAGLDAGRFPGAGAQDPILLDAERASLAGGELPGAVQRLEERQFELAALLSRLRGPVHLSWPAWDASEARSLAPSPVVLQAYRLMTGDRNAGFNNLEEHAGNPVARIPPGASHLDAEDVWLAALSGDGHLLAGEAQVRACFPSLDRGLAARAARNDAPSAHRGLVSPRPELDPRSGSILSPSRLETLGRCPLRYFYRYVLGASPPEDPAFDPERWLDPLHRGALLHRVYDRLLREARGQNIAFNDDRFLQIGLTLLREEAELTRVRTPAPSDAVFDRECEELALDVASFVGMTAQDAPDWAETEMRFGFGDEDRPAVLIQLESGSIRIRGAVDRIDRMLGDSLRVVDYKTGSARSHGTSSTWKGGRRLQHYLYSRAAERLLAAPVARMEYHFPTRKGENRRSVFAREQLEGGAELVERLLDVAASGQFLPTDDKEDCKFCDFQSVCRVRQGAWGVQSPPADWGAAQLEGDAYERFRRVRGFEDAR